MSCTKSQLLETAKTARIERAEEKRKEYAIIKIQSLVRRFLARSLITRQIQIEMDNWLQIPKDINQNYKPKIIPALDVFHLLEKYRILSTKKDILTYEYICRYIVISMNSEVISKNVYVSVLLVKECTLAWIAQLKSLLISIIKSIDKLQPDNHLEMKTINIFLHFLIMFTATNSWKFMSSKNGEVLQAGMSQLCNNCLGHLATNHFLSYMQKLLLKCICRSKSLLNSTNLTAIFTLCIRPLAVGNFSDSLMHEFIIHILSIPAFVHFLNTIAFDCLLELMTQKVFTKCLDFFNSEDSLLTILKYLEGNYSLCLLANLIQLGCAEKEGLVKYSDKFLCSARRILVFCEQYVEGKKSNLTHWHPVFGWFAQKTDTNLNEALPLVVAQLSELWTVRMVGFLFEPLFAFAESAPPGSNVPDYSAANNATQPKNLLRRALKSISQTNGTSTGGKLKPGSAVVRATCHSCATYLAALTTMRQLKMEMMAGLCFQESLLSRLWFLLSNLGSNFGLNYFLDAITNVSSKKPLSHELFDLLRLSCEGARHVLILLDDVEMYDQQDIFPLPLLVSASAFLNKFIFTSIHSNLIQPSQAEDSEVFNSIHGLLVTLYDRDCRRSFTPPNHWLLKEVRSSSFLSELADASASSDNLPKSAARFILKKIPFAVPHRERVILFRKSVTKDKSLLRTSSSSGTPVTLITVHRSRLIEDGLRQLTRLSSNSLKSTIRVRFVNVQGLDEAGIDQDGVFKEFLEEIVKSVFNPSFNLFRVTPVEGRLYPSPTSYLQDNHLQLFEFIGRMLGKAVYESIVIDVYFASFFLTQILGPRSSAAHPTYSSLDELPSLDPDLYKNLTYVKHYNGDVSDLSLSFCYEEDVMGQLVTRELVPGGRLMPVTNSNRIAYIHLMAHSKMRAAIAEQMNAFARGFRSIIHCDWLDTFSSAPELQRLISGDSEDIDLDDLRKHTQYYGGFHNGHRVIMWLWDVLAREFSAGERRLFLKFVTSCSKGPLLGFANLEPPFSIRCVEVGDDQDEGDTVGSVLKGFFGIGGQQKDLAARLPTSSTCFNLLKLPNYKKKSTLREKLRYSITSNTGFELS